MKRLYTLLLSVSLIILLSLILVAGCEEQPVPTPEPSPTTPLTPIPESPPVPSPAPQEPAAEPSPVPPSPEPEPSPPPPSPEPISEPEPEPETAEPLIHSCAYIKFDGIDGESQDKDHKGWSEIVSFSQPIHRPSSGTDTSRRRGDVVIEDIVVVKEIDKASPKLAEAICTGKVFPKVEIHLTGPSEGSTCQGTFYIYELKNVMITSYKATGSNPLAYALITPAPDSILPYSGPFIVQAVDAPIEELSLNFEEIKVTYTECDPSTGKSKGNVEYSWKVEEGESY
jgi:type VI secretion system secreted protein Hcp